MPGFDHRHYVPILKGKQGEFSALSQIPGGSRARLTPLIEIAPRDIDWRTDLPSESTTDALDGDAERLFRAWSNDEVFVDLGAFDPADRLDDGRHPVSGFFDDARAAGLAAIPVTGLDRDPAYQVAVAGALGADARGAAVRLTLADTNDLTQLEADLTALARSLGVNFRELDLVVDLAEITATTATGLESEADRALRGLPRLQEWRTLTLCSGAFPVSPASSIPPRSSGHLPRRDWELWNNLLNSAPALPRLPAFGDYAIAHPDWVIFNPQTMTMTGNIRYTAGDSWFVVRGGALRGAGGQFFDLAATAAAVPVFRGSVHCEGCDYIDRTRQRQTGPGNSTTWRTVGTRHHLAQVDDQIANLP